MRSLCVVTLALAVVASMSFAAQEAQPAKPCVAADEPVYKPGKEGVKPPQLQPEKPAENAPVVRSPFSLEVLVNREGRVCEARVVSAKDPLSARKAADFIKQHWVFAPAIREGKPVAVKFTTNFYVGK